VSFCRLSERQRLDWDIDLAVAYQSQRSLGEGTSSFRRTGWGLHFANGREQFNRNREIRKVGALLHLHKLWSTPDRQELPNR
jgi:hypothetical protein